jgi:divalent metal cation (Fe/Co/Zn/Cd) transporter
MIGRSGEQMNKDPTSGAPFRSPDHGSADFWNLRCQESDVPMHQIGTEFGPMDSIGVRKSDISSPDLPATPDILRRIVRLQLLTIAWMTIEVVVALASAGTARSPALLGFGGDSAVELFSAIIVFWRFRFRSDSPQSEKLAARVAGGLLFLVAGLIIAGSGLSLLGYREPRPSLVGIILLIVAAIIMPWLARRKRKLAAQVASAALRADASESAVCGYLSLIVLAGLLTNALFHAPWADPLAALALVPFVTREAWQATHISRHGCDCSL